MYYRITHLLAFFLFAQLCQAQSDTETTLPYESPVILSLWNGGTFPENDVNFTVSSTWFILNNFNFNYKNKLEAGVSLLSDEASGYIKYNFQLGNNLQLSPSVYVSESVNSQVRPSERKLLFNPGLTLKLSSDDNSYGIQLSYYKLLTNDNSRTNLFDINASDYALGFNYYQFLSPRWMMNLELFGANDRMMNQNSSEFETHMFLNFCYSKNIIVSYNFGFWYQMTNQNDYCDLFCIYFLPMIGISIDLSRAIEKGKD